MQQRYLVPIAAAVALVTGILACGGLAPLVSPRPDEAQPTPGQGPTLAGTSCRDPAPPGKAVVVDDMEMMVNAVARPADGAVMTGSAFNPTPEPGNEFILIWLSVRCRKSETEHCSLDPSLNFALMNRAGASSEIEAGITGVPGMLDVTEFVAGSTIYRAMAFEVARNERDLVLAYRGPSGTTRACLAIPYWMATSEALPTAQQTPTATPEPPPTPRPLPTPTAALTPTPVPIVLLPESGGLAQWPLAVWWAGAAAMLCGFLWRCLSRRRPSRH